MFPTDFNIELKLELNPKYGQFEAFPAKLSCKEKEYKMTFFPNSELEDKLAFIANDFIWGKLSSFFILSECRIENESVSVKSDKSHISGIHVNFDMTTKVRTWEIRLNCITIHKKATSEELADNNTRKYYLLNYGTDIIAELPVKDFTYESIQKDIRLNRVLKYKSSDIIIGYDSDAKYPFMIITQSNPDILNEALALLSFYYFKPIKDWICIKQDGNWIVYNFTAPFVAHEKDAERISHWDFYSINGDKRKRINLEIIFESASNVMHEQSQLFHDVMFRALQTHVDILNDSEQSQFVFYTSILLTIAEKIHKFKMPAIQSVKKLFKLTGIRFSQIDDEQNRLQKQHFKRSDVLEERNGCLYFFFNKKSRNDEINTFIDLRNEFVHGLPTPEMLAYIHDSLLLSKLKHCVFLVILYELGIKAKYTYYVNNLNVQK